MSLTKSKIDRLAYTASPSAAGKYPMQAMWDESLPGFGVRVYPSGQKSFIMGYTVRGRKRFLTLGKYGPLTLDEARKKAKRQLGKVADGADPGEDKRKAQRADTVAKFAPKYIDDHAAPKKRSWKEDERRINKHIVPMFGNRALDSITDADVSRLHNKIGKSAKIEANRVVTLISSMYAVAKKWGDVPRTFLNPAEGIEAFPEKSRDRWVTHEEFPALWGAIQAERNAHVRAYFTLTLMLGTRKTELLGARWENVNFERAELTLPDTKSGSAQIVDLPPEAIDVLKSLRGEKRLSPFVFPSPVDPGEPMKDIRRQWKRIRTAAKLEDVTVHDLRRTVGSWMASSGESLHVIGKVLRHEDAEVTKVYARLASSVARGAMERHASAIVAAGNKK